MTPRGIAKSRAVVKAVALWRASFHPLEWPHQGCERAQEHYRVCLSIYRGRA